ncbi:helix-turn-helix domain-containing protein [Sansalvadorimonas sp. 2012CJ34-2]|uniref:Helix-turn-helix domain-containing protein n=1 Tax=Parendozoicomonas callyspongiae TaxID=2942213 RepID=A0ABT0PLL9_9GAMM|nr:helix-turn-helix domain-containing protein [Sansalvadorimonas sp. 2012CJ34-2]MCL6272285.1 helix-turn-helix domain-containing protein [Sansalvadorimonas sp. 2012CJ34-2]
MMKKIVTPITDSAIIDTLKYAMRNGPLPYVRERAHAVLLSSKGYSLAQIADIFGVQYQTISQWVDDWECLGIQGLYKDHGGGKPTIYNDQEIERLAELIAEEPRRISYAQAKLEEETGKRASLKTLKRAAKKNRFGI